MVIVRLVGGLGNQLFIYAAARRLALKNNVRLKLDIISGFQRDFYRRQYCLNKFNIKAEIASPTESFMGILGRIRRKAVRKISQLRKFEKRMYIVEESNDFDPRLLSLKTNRIVFLEGYWQSEKYFKDIENIIREDFEIISEHDLQNLNMAKKIESSNAVCLHVRRLHGVANMEGAQPLPDAEALEIDYYNRAVAFIAKRVSNPVFYCFGDYPKWMLENIKINFPTVFITHNNSDEKSHEDLWLMSLCKHFIICNSTFSWWGAWLASNQDKIVIAPAIKEQLRHFNSTSKDLIPEHWIKFES
jgi:hypothetical protein